MLSQPGVFRQDALHSSRFESLPDDKARYCSPAPVSHSRLKPTSNHLRVSLHCCESASASRDEHGRGRERQNLCDTLPRTIICRSTQSRKHITAGPERTAQDYLTFERTSAVWMMSMPLLFMSANASAVVVSKMFAVASCQHAQTDARMQAWHGSMIGCGWISTA